MYEFTGTRTREVDGKTVLDEVQPLNGIGPGPFADEDFEAKLAAYEAQFDDGQRGAVIASGMYRHVPGSLPEPIAETPPAVEPADADEEE